MKKLIVFLLLWMTIVIHYKSGRTDTYTNIDSYQFHKDFLYIFTEDNYSPLMIPIHKIQSWEVRND